MTRTDLSIEQAVCGSEHANTSAIRLKTSESDDFSPTEALSDAPRGGLKMLGGKAPPTRAPETSCSHDAPCERPFRFRDISRHVVAGRAVHAVYFQGRENDEAGDAARGCGYDAATATDAACEEQRRMRMEIARLVLGVLLLVAFALLTVQLYNGRWLFLIAKPEKTKKGTFFPEGTANTGKRAAWVMVACFAVTATLMAYEMSKMTGVRANLLHPQQHSAGGVLPEPALDAVRGSRRAELSGSLQEGRRAPARLAAGSLRRHDRALDSVRLISAPAYVRWRGRRGR